MRTIAFVGSSGTGKSHRAMTVAKKYGADAVIDDGLLISGTKVLAGVSAKREQTKISSVRRALFTTPSHVVEVRNAIKNNNINCVMILGTSDAMVEKIATMLKLPKIENIIRIEDVATSEEIEKARDMRQNQGKHVIPVPTFEIKKDFSGYFIHPLRIFQKSMDKPGELYEVDKSIVRPTFSYMGNYEISDNVIALMASHEALKNPYVCKINSVNIRKTEHGVHMDIIAVLKFGCNITNVCRNVQYVIEKNIERYTSINVRYVHIYVRGIK